MYDKIAQGDRPRADRHARPPARLPLDDGHQARQARLLREAAGASHRRGAGPGRGRPAGEGRHADGQPGLRHRRAPDAGRVARGRARSASCWKCMPGTSSPIVSAAACRKPEPEPVPKGLDWDAWLGPARERPFATVYRPWHGWCDFGTGSLGGWGPHLMDAVCFALKLGYPQRVELLDVGDVSEDRFPRWSTVRYDFPQRGELPPISRLLARRQQAQHRRELQGRRRQADQDPYRTSRGVCRDRTAWTRSLPRAARRRATSLWARKG